MSNDLGGGGSNTHYGMSFQTITVDAPGIQGFAAAVQAEYELNYAPNIALVMSVLDPISAGASFGLVSEDYFPTMYGAGQEHLYARNKLLELKFWMGGPTTGESAGFVGGMPSLAHAANTAAEHFTDQDFRNAENVGKIQELFLATMPTPTEKIVEDLRLQLGMPPTTSYGEMMQQANQEGSANAAVTEEAPDQTELDQMLADARQEAAGRADIAQGEGLPIDNRQDHYGDVQTPAENDGNRLPDIGELTPEDLLDPRELRENRQEADMNGLPDGV